MPQAKNAHRTHLKSRLALSKTRFGPQKRPQNEVEFFRRRADAALREELPAGGKTSLNGDGARAMGI
jgi:hypothetical protein